FVPRVVTLQQLPLRMERMKRLWEAHLHDGRPRRRHIPGAVAEGPHRDEVCLLPGPVTTAKAVEEAFHQPPVYHRGPEFIQRFAAVRRLLGDIVGGRDVAIFNGSGTLANETIAA